MGERLRLVTQCDIVEMNDGTYVVEVTITGFPSEALALIIARAIKPKIDGTIGGLGLTRESEWMGQ